MSALKEIIKSELALPHAEPGDELTAEEFGPNAVVIKKNGVPWIYMPRELFEELRDKRAK